MIRQKNLWCIFYEAVDWPFTEYSAFFVCVCVCVCLCTKLRYDAIFILFLVATGSVSRRMACRWRLKCLRALAGWGKGHCVIGHITYADATVSCATSSWKTVRGVVFFLITARARAGGADTHHIHIINRSMPIDSSAITGPSFGSTSVTRSSIHCFIHT